MNRTSLNDHVAKNFNDLMSTMKAAQQEYASDADAFENFNKLSASLKLDRKKVLWVYLQKHLDGILTYLDNPNRASREPISGRIGDAVIYLMILDAMIMEENKPNPAANQGLMSHLDPSLLQNMNVR